MANERHGEPRNQRQIHALLRALADKRNVSRKALDDLAGLSESHSERCLSEIPEKRIGIDTMFKMFRGLGVKMVVEDCPQSLERIAEYLNGRADYMVRASVGSRPMRTRAALGKIANRLVKKDRRKWARSANDARKRKLTAKRRSAIARHAARVRHKRERERRRLLRNAPAPLQTERLPQSCQAIQPKCRTHMIANGHNDNLKTAPGGALLVHTNQRIHHSARSPRRGEDQQASKGERRADPRAPQA